MATCAPSCNLVYGGQLFMGKGELKTYTPPCATPCEKKMVPPWPLLAAELHAARTLPVLSCCTTADETEATAFAASVTVVPLMAVMVVEKIPFVVVLGGFAGRYAGSWPTLNVRPQSVKELSMPWEIPTRV